MSKTLLARIEQQAKEELRAAAGPQRRNVFLSFAYEDINEVQLLRGQALNPNSELDFSDRSVQDAFPTTHEPTIERGIRDKIRQASVTVCYLTDAAASSDWVDWEIRESIRLGKGVVCVYPGDAPPRMLPSAVREYNIKVVPWTHEPMMQAIDDAAREGPPVLRS